MNNSLIKPLILGLIMVLSLNSHAQTHLWQPASISETTSHKLEANPDIPSTFEIYKLNSTSLKNCLAQAPERFNQTSEVIIDLPTEGGELQKFRVYEASNFDPILQEKYPNIRSYAAQGIDDPSALARFSVSDYGVNISISSGRYSSIRIKPYTQDKTYYIMYHLQDLPPFEGFDCQAIETLSPILPSEPAERTNSDGYVTKFRMAMACTSTYSQYHLELQGIDSTASDEVKRAVVMSAINDAMTVFNGIFERDISVTMTLVPNNDELIVLYPENDPYNEIKEDMIHTNQEICDDIIGNENYDIGHVISGVYFGGLAYVTGACHPEVKAGGVSGGGTPNDDYFYFVTCHEIGHQFGGNHTFNNCGGYGSHPSSSMEPGSGTTILSYAGVCPPNVQGSTDGYFHAASIRDMFINIDRGASQCGIEIDTNNSVPVVDAGPRKTIPKSTPFILEGVATDADDPTGESLTYTWEQMDPQEAPMPPQNTNPQGPLFRSLPPSNQSFRFMPDIIHVINGRTQGTWEVVPSVDRQMNFRLTVRDNHPGGGATSYSNKRIITDANSGPFVVTSQNTSTTWNTQTTEVITWDVAGTDQEPVNCTHVDVFFSTDLGFTYPITIATQLPNTGSAVINVPNLNTTSGRLMIKASDNVFYNVSRGKITVTGELETDNFVFESFAVYPNPSTGIFNLTFKVESTDAVDVSLYDLRGRLIRQNTFNNISSDSFNSQLDYNAIENGVYFLVVKNGGKIATKKLVKN